MSASLVGSEMCIRDSDWMAGLRIGPGPRNMWIRPGQQLRDKAALSSLKPVSYTHLTLPTICSV
eukprot:12404962-Alexandrium_andersonii.AAC.1